MKKKETKNWAKNEIYIQKWKFKLGLPEFLQKIAVYICVFDAFTLQLYVFLYMCVGKVVDYILDLYDY